MGNHRVIYPPDRVRKIWETISPYDDAVPDQLAEVLEWLNRISVKDDCVLVQGEFGAVFYLVEYCFFKRLRPIYATTERRSVEKVLDDGSVEQKHLFKHVRYRSYRRYYDE